MEKAPKGLGAGNLLGEGRQREVRSLSLVRRRFQGDRTAMTSKKAGS